MSPPPGTRRSVRETLLIVGEGDADVAIVRHMKRIYAGVMGRSVQEINAHGKGGRNVLETALRRANSNRAYDKVVLLLDVDTDWDDSLRAKARKARIGRRQIGVIEADPCLEAWLLEIFGVEVAGDTQQTKRRFKKHTGCEAHESDWMGRLSRDVLDEARERVPQLAELMNHMGIPKP